MLNHAGVAELLKGPEIQADLTARGQRIADAAGDGVEVEVPFVGQNRARVTVRTATFEAMVNEAEDRTLTRAIDAGR